ncbi:MAG: MBL fold metallo-hydrolase [Bacteroidia bacterium]|nr:MBL fold metallo-hydrolase [Bacteroidia bacterium]
MNNSSLPLVVILFLSLTALLCCDKPVHKDTSSHQPFRLLVLGNVQDGGSPHIGCNKSCCKELFEKPDPNRKVVSLGLIDAAEKKTFMFEATPDFPTQTKQLNRDARFKHREEPHGVFLTHAHIGHYSGLMYLGMEAMNARKTPVYVMPRMDSFLSENGPWDQLVSYNNIELERIHDQETVSVTSAINVTPFRVPHRDEYSETVGYRISGPNRSALFIPDIDKWSKWDKSIIDEIKSVDYAFVDGTFYNDNELVNRNMSDIPHPFVVESLELFAELDKNERKKIYFIHFNHTNPLLNVDSEETKNVLQKGFNIARIGDEFNL